MGGGGSTEKMKYTAVPLGLLGAPWSNLTEKALRRKGTCPSFIASL